MIVWRVLVGIYATAVVVALVIVNADQSDTPAAAGAVGAAALALGWGTGSAWGAVVAWLLIPLALPFGDTNRFSGADDTDAVALLAVVSAVLSTLLILVAAGARTLYNRHHPSGRTSEASEAGALQALDPPPGR